MECKTNDLLKKRKPHKTGVLRTWVAGQVGRAIWVQMDETAHLVPYNLGELMLKACICAAMSVKPEIRYPQGWQCPFHGFVAKGTELLGACATQEAFGHLKQVIVT